MMLLLLDLLFAVGCWLFQLFAVARLLFDCLLFGTVAVLLLFSCC
jgi:hypothetical protein